MTALPPNHPQRIEINDEVHARPPERLSAPARVTYLALIGTPEQREASFRAIAGLAERFGATPPAPGANHFSADLGPFRVKWERHSEFVRCKFIVPGDGGEAGPFAAPALSAVPSDWVAALPGEVIAAAHVALLPAGGSPPHHRDIAAAYFGGNVLIGAAVSGQAATAYTDFRIHADGFSRVLILNRDTTPWQAGRITQRLLEIDTYRVLAMLALPVAHGLAPLLARGGQELGDITTALVDAGEKDEPELLDRLTRLSAEIDSAQARTRFRFSAAEAYDELVDRRIKELREERIQGLQTFREFTDRRMAPAMQTCRSVSARIESLSQRVARATQLLSTRVDVTRERQNQALLESMNRRVKLQLRLQSTVEGLSVAAITYYIASLVGRVAEALEVAGLHINPSLAEGIAIPLIAGGMAIGIRRVRRLVHRAP
jgi:uncharacterized membrane-anchored protein